uniref:AAA+ ATPase domain-containing protein n=1 Tax=viral metagenome TaxID=1070528 RepID=A0A6C0EPD2_9ZZZZ
MYAETYRPNTLEDVIGHTEAKDSLRKYLRTPGFPRAVMLTGSPGIGKTTLALAAAKTMEFDPLEINASRSIRSYEDVERIKDACRSVVNIHSFIRGDRNKKTCVILDEVDGSDPHAQGKIIEWIKDPTRKVPIICTGNELPTIFKRNTEHIEIIRCFPPRGADIQTLFSDIDITEMIKECQHDVRKLIHRIQYGNSDPIPKYSAPPTGLPVEKTFLLRQRMFDLPDSLLEYRVDIQDNEPTLKTSSRYKVDGKHARTAESDILQKKSHPDKSHNSKTCLENPLVKH